MIDEHNLFENFNRNYALLSKELREMRDKRHELLSGLNWKEHKQYLNASISSTLSYAKNHVYTKE